jgi:hypothetical protein
LGHLCSRFFTHLPTSAVVRPKKIRRKSLFRNILRITCLFPIFYAVNTAYLNENKDLQGEGGGVPMPPNSQTGNDTLPSHQPQVTSHCSPCYPCRSPILTGSLYA